MSPLCHATGHFFCRSTFWRMYMMVLNHLTIWHWYVYRISIIPYQPIVYSQFPYACHAYPYHSTKMVILHVIFSFFFEIDFSRHENPTQIPSRKPWPRDTPNLPWIPRWFRGAPWIKASCSAWPKCRAEFILPAMTPPEWTRNIGWYQKKNAKNVGKWRVKLDETHGMINWFQKN